MQKNLLAVASLCLVFLGAVRSAWADVESTRISLPKGPGSIEGLGSSDFTANFASGQASYSIPIAVPPAVRSFGPNLTLSYDSGAGISEIALGWRLSGTLSVRRRTQEGLPRFDESDSFEVVGLGTSSELLEVAPGEFRPRFEDGTFLQARRQGEQWELRTKAGVTHFLGHARLMSIEGDTVAYLLDRSVDRRGHTVRYEWRTSGQYPLLERVVWNDERVEFANEVLFEYGERPDTSRLYSSGLRQDLTRRLHRISVLHGGSLVRRYDLTFNEDAHPRLTGVTLVGTDGTTRWPTLRFRYSSELDERASSAALVQMRGAPGRAPGSGDVGLVDLNGDSLPDLLIGTAGEYSSVLNVDGTTWEARQTWEPSRSPSLSLGTPGVHLADFDGDGAADLLTATDGAGARYLARSSETRFDEEVLIESGIGLDLASGNVRLADFDGDRRIDVAMTTDSGLVIARNQAGVAFESPRVSAPIDPDQEVSFETVGTDLCDINGDRVLDICKLRSASLVYYLGRGRGAFEPPEEGQGVPTFGVGEPYRVRDLDGDGWDDLVRIGTSEVSYVLAVGEGRFGPVRSIEGVPTKGSSTQTFFADMNGSGSVDIVWVDVNSDEAAWQYLELFPGGRAGLLIEADSGQGKKQTIEYAPAARLAVSNRAASKAHGTRLNVAMPVVARVTVDTGLGDPPLVREYEYVDGTYDPSQRTFSVFGSVTVREVGDEFTPTLVTLRQFDSGLASPSLRGALLLEERSGGDGSVFSRRTYDYLVRRLENAGDEAFVEYGYAKTALTEVIEGHEDQAVILRSDFEQDEFGNVVLEQHWGVVDGDDPLALDDERIVVRTFANDPGEWALGYLASETIMNGAGEVVAGSRRSYDGPAFVGLPRGFVARGELTREEAWVGPGEDDFELVTAARYDDHGLPVETKDACGGGRFFRWDDARTHVVFEGIKLKEDDRDDELRLVERATLDERFGVLLESTDYGGGVTRYEYDVFGRLTAVIRPGDSSEQPTFRYRYEPGSPLSRVVTDARVESGRDFVERREDVFDGLGRKRASLVLDSESWLLAGIERYDARGQLQKTLPPRWASESERRNPPLQEERDGAETWRDALGRVVHTRSAQGTTTRTSYGPLTVSHWDGGQADPESGFEHTPILTVRDGQERVIRHQRTLRGAPVASTYTYDAAGNLLMRTDPDGHVQSFRYDGRGRRSEAVDPDQGTHTFGYDSCGNRIEHVFPDGEVNTSTYDLAGRLVSENWDEDEQPEVVREYDRGPVHHRAKLVRVTEPSGFTDYAYDERGNVAESRYGVDGHEYLVESRYDAQDREVEHVYPDGSRLRIGRNARGLPSDYGKLVRIEYGPEGTETKRRFSTGAEVRGRYDRDQRRTQLELEDAAGVLVESLRWTYDGAGNLTELVSLTNRGPRSATYAYDNLHRMIGMQAKWGTIDWSYSDAGNLLARRSTWDALDAPNIDYGTHAHAPTRLGDRLIRYDVRGRMISDGQRAYEWDGMSRVARVTRGSAKVESTYGAQGARRISRAVDENGRKSTTYFLDAWSEVRDGKLVRYVVHGGERIVRLGNGPRADELPGSGVFASPGGAQVRWTWGPACIACTLLALMFAVIRSLLRTDRGAGRTVPVVALLVGGLAGCGPVVDDRSAEMIRGLRPGDRLLMTDQVGSLWAETDDQGTVLTSQTFEPFGRRRVGKSEETNQFAGTPRDEAVTLDHMGERFYAPDLGLWTSADPVSLLEPERQITSEFAAAHPYAYANLRPLVVVDRDGRYGQYIAAGAGVLVGGGLEALRQYYQFGAVRNWGLVAGGAAFGGVLGYGLTMSPTTLLQSAGTGAVNSVALGVARRLIESEGKSPGTARELLTDAALGATSGLLTKGLGQLKDVTKVASKGPVASPAAAGADDVLAAAQRGVASGAAAGVGRSLPAASVVGSGGSAAGATPWLAGVPQEAASGSLWTLGWSAQTGRASAFGVVDFVLQPSGMVGIALRVP